MMNTEEQERIDRFEKLRSELADLDDEALKARFWELCHQVMEPVVELAVGPGASATSPTSGPGESVGGTMGIRR